MYGIMYGVKRTTVYFPEEMKAVIEREAARRGVTEAEVIRTAVESLLGDSNPPIPDPPLFPNGFGTDIAGRVDDLLDAMAGDVMEDM
jgi:hypothetical protein